MTDSEDQMAGARIEGIILAAGMGTRMLPLTEIVPKPLLPVAGVPLVEIAAKKLLASGASSLHINLFHLGGSIREFCESAGWPVKFHEEAELLDTGGGIGNMAGDLGDADHVLLHNGDVIASFGYLEALRQHIDTGALVTMLLMKPEKGGRTPPPAVTVSPVGEVLDIGSGGEMGYTGMAVLSQEALGYFPAEKKGLVPVLLGMAAERPGAVRGFDASRLDECLWGEIGSPSSYIDLHRRILLERAVFDPAIAPPPMPLRTGEGSSIDPGARWSGFLDIGDGARIEKSAFLEDCIVLGGAVVAEGTAKDSAIFYGTQILEADK
jgi:mannose-1-phosphate guanylyltransferase